MKHHTRMLAALAIVTALTTVGCSSPSTDRATLASTKSPAQLLRNEIADRVPAEIIGGEPDTIDRTESCDADGLLRSWRSAARLAIVSDKASTLGGVADSLVASFVDQGWEASTRDASSRLVEHRLTSSTSSADVHITVDAGSDDGADASLLIVVNGPCVVTDGPDSDEVRKLENQK